jgi:RHS repeat-associated protein
MERKTMQTESWEIRTTMIYGFRIYNPGIARFLSVDPLAPDFSWNSPYAFSEGSPISNIDLDGLESTISERIWPGVLPAEIRPLLVFQNC